MKRSFMVFAAFAAFSAQAFAQTAVPRSQSPQPAPPAKGVQLGDSGQFVAKATMSNMLEIESSRLALEKTKAQNIREFAQTMITDHTKASQELDAILKESNATTTPTNKLDASHQQQIDKLKKADSAQFDREYLILQTKAHDDAITLFRTYAQSGTDAKLKAFAQKTLPELERHAELVRKLPR